MDKLDLAALAQGITPAPWRAVGEFPANIQDVTGWTLARCFFRDSTSDDAGDEHDANARLIAAAPTLLVYARQLEAENARLRAEGCPYCTLIAELEAQVATLRATLRAALEQACVAMSLRYGYDRDAEAGYAEVAQRYGGGMASAYEQARAALAEAPPDS